MKHKQALYFLIFATILISCMQKTPPSAFIEKWKKSTVQNDSTFLLLGQTIYTDSVTLVHYKIPYSVLSPPNCPFRTFGVMYLNNGICFGIDSTTNTKFVLFDFNLKEKDTIFQKSPWASYPDSFKITLDKVEYIKEWKDTIYKFRYMDMGWEYMDKKAFRTDWIWCISKNKGFYGLNLECVNSNESFYSGKIGKFPASWGEINVLDYCVH
jgi:hypothetical protein